MSRLSLTLPLIAMLAICLPRHLTLGQEKLVESAGELIPVSNRSCVFADEKTFFDYSPKNVAARHADWQIDWSLMVGARTIARGSSEAIVPADSDVPLYLAEIPTPTLRDDVVLSAELRMTWTAGRKKYQHNRPLFIFSRNLFPTKQSLLENAQIKLFDADGRTAELLEKNEIPHSRLLNLSAIDLVTEGIVLVGEGVSFRKQRKLAESLLRVAQRGVPVLCLAPSEGDIPLAMRQEGELIRPSRLALERGHVVRRYDKRFDEIPIVCHLSLESRRNEVVLSAIDGKDDWAWLDMEFSPEASGKPPGRLIVCGLGIVTHWDKSPVPRYLFVRLLEELTSIQSTMEKQKNVFTQ
ncbi:MAG: hypothetical protein GXP26_05595 [Planctomycetes bacterium]|nr:hypothetical protein [Planctomycetota bacterium]